MIWRIKLEFEYEIVYKNGKSKVNADEIDTEEKLLPILRIHRDETRNYQQLIILIDNKEENVELFNEYHDNQLGGDQGHQRTLAALKIGRE